MKLAQDVKSVIGEITPPVGGLGQNPVSDLTRLLSLILQIVLVVAGLLLLLYLFWGAFDYITSSGDKEKASKAQNKIVNALVGMLLLIGAIALFGIIGGDILGIIKNTPQGWEIQIPHL